MKTILLPLALLFMFHFGAKATISSSDTINTSESLQQARIAAFQNAQGAKLKARQGKWLPGGSFGMAFGNQQTTISIAPQIGYNQNPYFTVGGGVTYNYYHARHTSTTLHYVGLNIYGEVIPLPFLAFRLQPELYEGWGKGSNKTLSAELIPTILVGGGIRLPLGKGTASIMFYYDVLQHDNTPYGDNVFYTVGYIFSF